MWISGLPAREKKNLVGEVAYRCSKDGQRRQGIFASTGREDGGETGVALFVRECFYGTNKVNLNDELVLLTAPYELGSGETVLIATCQFDKEDANKRVRQAEALAAYADQVKQNIVICASVYENESGNVFNILKKKYRRSCKFSSKIHILPFNRIEIRLCVDSFVPELGNTGGSG